MNIYLLKNQISINNFIMTDIFVCKWFIINFLYWKILYNIFQKGYYLIINCYYKKIYFLYIKEHMYEYIHIN